MTIISLAWDVTYACNSRCIHCYNCSGRPLKDELNMKEQLDVCKQILETNIMGVDFLGGEPLLCENLFKLSEFLKQKNIKLGIITNGILLSRFYKNIGKYFDSVQVSLDGIKEISDKIRFNGSFEKSVMGIKKISSFSDVNVLISSVATKTNENNISKIIDIAHKLNIKTVKFSKYLPTGRGLLNKYLLQPINYTNLMEEIKEKSKSLGINVIWEDPMEMFNDILPVKKSWIGLTANGHITPNPFLPFSIGNIRDNKLNEYLEKAMVYKKIDIGDLRGKTDVEDLFAFKKLFCLDIISRKENIGNFTGVA
ncbi:MAG: radical SAM protein [Candidatus Woesearchaeota archaeon]